MKKCHHCKNELNTKDKVGRTDTCPHCGNELHCCFNCKFYDEYAHNKCQEPQSEYVSERQRSNFCDYFVFKDAELNQKSAQETKKAKERFKELFKL